jgi:hypothetical protein
MKEVGRQAGSFSIRRVVETGVACCRDGESAQTMRRINNQCHANAFRIIVSKVFIHHAMCL